MCIPFRISTEIKETPGAARLRTRGKIFDRLIDPGRELTCTSNNLSRKRIDGKQRRTKPTHWLLIHGRSLWSLAWWTRGENNSDKHTLDFLRSIVGHRHTNFQHSNESARASFIFFFLFLFFIFFFLFVFSRKSRRFQFTCD